MANVQEEILNLCNAKAVSLAATAQRLLRLRDDEFVSEASGIDEQLYVFIFIERRKKPSPRAMLRPLHCLLLIAWCSLLNPFFFPFLAFAAAISVDAAFSSCKYLLDTPTVSILIGVSICLI